MKHLLLLQLILGLSFIAFAQTNTQKQNKEVIMLTGRLQDSLHGQPVNDATVSLINAGDSSLIGFTRTDFSGKFIFLHLRPGYYHLSVSHVNFHSQWKNVALTETGTAFDLGHISMRDKNLLDEIMLHTQRPPVEVKGDTLEFNAESFKTKPNAVVEDLLKKMPGIAVDKDGTVRVNGKQINRVLVNGKDFFNGDPKMATRNLSADAIDKVQVFDKQSDQSAFTGIDDGNAEKTINLRLKKDKKNAAFGKMDASAGTQDRYDAQFNVNRFNGDQQLWAMGMANNSNRQGFSIMDILNFTGQSKRMMGGGMVISTSGPEDIGLPVNGISNNEGIVKTIAGGMNYSDNWKMKTAVNASYFYNDLSPENTRTVSRQNILPGNNFIWSQIGNSSSTTKSHRLNFTADHKIDSFNSIRLTSVIGYQKGIAGNQSDYESLLPAGKMLNSGITNTTNSTHGYNTANTLLYRHKFKKRGRTFSLNNLMQYNDSRSHGSQNSINNFYTDGAIGLRDTLNQVSKIAGTTQSYGVNLSYTEPLSTRTLLEFKSFYNSSRGDLNRTTFDYNKINGKYDIRNYNLSNAFESRYNYLGAGLSFRVQKKKYGYTIGSNLQYAKLISQGHDSLVFVETNFTNLLPAASFNYNFSKMKSLRIDYNSATSQPYASQLQPVKDISDPINIKEGNPFLQQSYNHNLSLQFFNGNPEKQKNLFAFVNYFATQQAIVNSDVIDAGGSRITRPVNASGVYYVSGTVDRGFRLKKLNTRFTLGANIGFNHSVNFINDQKNITGNLSLAPRISANYTYKETVDINMSARISYNKAKYSLQSSANNNYWRQVYELQALFNLPVGFTINTEFSYSLFAGRSMGFNKSIALWNATLNKQVLKSKKGSIKICGYDLLKQNIGVDRNANSNYIEDIWYRTIQRFFTVGFTYSLQRATVGGPKAFIRTF